MRCMHGTNLPKTEVSADTGRCQPTEVKNSVTNPKEGSKTVTFGSGGEEMDWRGSPSGEGVRVQVARLGRVWSKNE
jgi:hypothetical protein